MRIVCIGGGPAALYFALLAKKTWAGCTVTVLERNRPDDTFGWGVVFSEETLGNFAEADPPSYAAIRASLANWDDIDTWVHGGRIRSTGHGFCGLARRRLLEILHERCRALGVRLRFETEVQDPRALARETDLLVGADGVNSQVRETWAEAFRPSVSWGRTRFSWLGTTKPMEAFTFIFLEGEHGLFRIHAYPFAEGLGTWIAECGEETWKRAGLDGASEEETVAYLERLFAGHLEGHRLLTNRSLWRRFPTVRCERWHDHNVVLLGDAAHTAHFSIGSGTKLAMEDAMALMAAFQTLSPPGDVPRCDIPEALARYQDARAVEALKLQRAAQTSQAWFEETERYMRQDPLPFVFNLLTRSKRITYDNLAQRDPDLVRRVSLRFAEKAGAPRGPDGAPPPPLFTPLRLRDLTLPNRVVVSPMCQYSAQGGAPTDWHLVHLGSRAVGGAGLVMTEMTNVSKEGCITHACAGIWDDAHVAPWKRIVDFVRANSPAAIGIQLGHAGRKGSCTLPWEGDDPLRDGTAWRTIAPSPLPYDEGWPVPREMDRADMERVVGEYVRAAERAVRAGFDLLEIHMAHGYLLSSFISPVSNRRADAYGGSLEGRMRFPLEVLDAVRAAWPRERPVAVRITASDWLEDGEGLTGDDAVEVARTLAAHGCDLVDVSSGGNTPASRPVYGRMYQVPFADRIRHEVGVRVMAVGAIQGWDHVNTILAAERADLCALARPHLVNPHITMGAAVAYGWAGHPWPRPYLPARPAARDGPRPPHA